MSSEDTLKLESCKEKGGSIAKATSERGFYSGNVDIFYINSPCNENIQF